MKKGNNNNCCQTWEIKIYIKNWETKLKQNDDYHIAWNQKVAQN